MANEIRVSDDLKSATVISDKFIADVEPDYCIVELANYTFKFDRSKLRELETVIELCKGIWEID